MSFRHLKDSHIGETCTVIANGPSLNLVPREFFAHYATFGCNFIAKLPYIPDFYTVVDKANISDSWEEIEVVPSPLKFVRENTQLSGYPLHCIPRREFSLQPNIWVWEGFSVVYVMLQLAYYLGFTTALVVGLDHKYQFEGDPKTPRLIDGPDPNHFSPDYYRGKIVTYPKLEISALAFRMARKTYEADGRRIINLTDGSAFDGFEFGHLDDWMKGKRK